MFSLPHLTNGYTFLKNKLSLLVFLDSFVFLHKKLHFQSTVSGSWKIEIAGNDESR